MLGLTLLCGALLLLRGIAGAAVTTSAARALRSPPSFVLADYSSVAPPAANPPVPVSFSSSSIATSHSFTPSSIISSHVVSSTVEQSGSLSTSSVLTSHSPSVTTVNSTALTSSANSTSNIPTSTSSVSGTAPTPTSVPNADPSTLADINTIHIRRLPFIIASATGASSISAWLSTLGPNGKWPDSEIDYTTGCDAQRANWPAETHWNRLLTMSSAWHGGLPKADQWVNSTDLRAAISLAMDFWFSNDFTGIACLDQGGQAACPCGTPGFWNTNWFSNIIGIPQLVGESCLLLNSTLTPTQLSNCTNISGRAYATFGRSIVGVGTLTGANTLDEASVGIDLGLLTVNATLVADAYGRIHREVVVQQALRADGIRPDGSFGQHGGIIYNGNYGKDYTNDVLALEIAAAGTQFEADSASQQAFASLIDGDQWMIYRNVQTGVLHWDFSVLGRFISFPVADNQATGSIKINITEFQTLGEAWGSDVLTDAFDNLSKNTSNANVGSLNGNRVFFDNDYVVQRGSGYVTTLRMYSSRTTNTECTNSQNPFGFHLSDGTIYTYLDGSEYEDIAAAQDWNLIPGTTVDYNATPLSCGQTQFAGIESFVGGASTGRAGVAAMRYTNPLTRALSWQKAWFFLPGDVQHVMVNSVRSASTAPVFSVLDQRKHVSKILVDGLSAQSGNFSSARTLWHGDIGYVFPSASLSAGLLGAGPNVSLTIDVGERTGNWTALGISTQPPPTVDLFSAWLVHGNGSDPVSYTMFPSVDYSTFLKKSAKAQRNLVDIRNDGNISAILDRAHGSAMVVFWSANGGNVTIPPNSPLEAPVILSSDKGLLAILDEKTWALTVSDPSQLSSSVGITLQLGDGRAPKGWGRGRSKTLSITLPTSGLAGSSVSTPLNAPNVTVS